MPKAEYKDRRYEVRPYDPAWPMQFRATADGIRDIFGADALSVEHVGSTAVPGMSGKPTIDVLVLVNDVSVAGEHAMAMKDVGYEYLIDYVLPGTVLFRRMENDVALENVHVFNKDHPHVREMLTLRDYLRSHPEEVAAYSKLKEDLFREYPSDYASYREHKDAYMKEMKARALKEMAL